MTKNGFSEILAIGAFLVLCFFVGRWTAPTTEPLVKTQYVLDTVQVKVAVPVEVERIVYQDIPKDIDSLEVAQSYFAKHPVNFSAEANEVKIEGKGVISQNVLDTFFLDITNYRPTTIMRPSYRNSIHAGIESGLGLLAFKASYHYKDWEVGLGYDVLTENQIGLLAEVKYRIKSW